MNAKIGVTLALMALVALEVGCASQSQGRYWEEKAALEEATRGNSVAGFDDFLARFPGSAWTQTAIYRRDKVAFEEAKKKGSPEVFREFIEKYPSSAWIEQAKYFLQYGYRQDMQKESNQPLQPNRGQAPRG